LSVNDWTVAARENHRSRRHAQTKRRAHRATNRQEFIVVIGFAHAVPH
jgi:hypothetical protein